MGVLSHGHPSFSLFFSRFGYSCCRSALLAVLFVVSIHQVSSSRTSGASTLNSQLTTSRTRLNRRDAKQHCSSPATERSTPPTRTERKQKKDTEEAERHAQDSERQQEKLELEDLQSERKYARDRVEDEIKPAIKSFQTVMLVCVAAMLALHYRSGLVMGYSVVGWLHAEGDDDSDM